jgi:predicted amidophosphoribosyltransferase
MAEYICPHCKKPIYDDDALLCLYCGESLDRSVGVMGALKFGRPKFLIVVLVLLVSLAFLLLMSR